MNGLVRVGGYFIVGGFRCLRFVGEFSVRKDKIEEESFRSNGRGMTRVNGTNPTRGNQNKLSVNVPW